MNVQTPIPRAIIGFFFACSLLLGACRGQEGKERTGAFFSFSKNSKAAEEGVPKPPHPLSIEGLRERDFPVLGIELRNAVEADEGLEAWDFTYDSEGYTIYGLLEKPAGAPPSPGGWPVIIVAHGYIPPDIFVTSKNYRSVTKYFAKGGFLVLKPDYRGHDRSEGIGDAPISTIDYSIDVLNLIEQIDSVPDADAEKVFLFGHSMGGGIGLRVLTVTKKLRGATLWAATSKGFPENTRYFIETERPKGVYSQELKEFRNVIEAIFTPDEYDSLDPGNYLDSIDVPILIHHGTHDHIVPLEWSTDLAEALEKAQADYTFYEYPGEDHNISVSYFKVMDRDMEFFRGLIE